MIAGLVLAAGAGTRFGADSKLLAELDGRPLLEHAVLAVCEVSVISRVVVVLGAHADEALERVSFGRAEAVICEDWSSGQAASLRRGVASLVGAEKVVVTLGDQPSIPPAVIARLAAQPGGARATYDGRPGHPVVLGPAQMSAVTRLRGDRGARQLLAGGLRIECSDLWSGRDVDTPEDLEAIRHEVRAVL